jgi:hypothetical protein
MTNILSPLTNSDIHGHSVGFTLRFNSELESKLQGPVPPYADLGFNVRRIGKFSRLRSLLLVSWLIGPAGFLLREDIRTYCFKAYRNDPSRLRLLVELELVGHSLTAAEKYCVASFSDRDWNGNQYPNMMRELELLKLKFYYPSKLKHQERIRGYRDHGSLRPNHQWLPKFDHVFNQEHERIEREREYFERSLVKFLELLVDRTELLNEEPYLRERLQEDWEEFLKK